MTFLVTGAAGFIGANLIRHLLNMKGKIHLILKEESNLWRIANILDKVIVHYGDLGDIEGLQAIVKKVKPDIIYHLATYGGYTFQSNAEVILWGNILGTKNLLKACSEIDYKLFVNTGSSAEYGAKTSAMRENDLLEPNSYYAVAKTAQTLLCQHIARAEKRPICTLRLFSVYGPYEEPLRLIPQVITSCLKGKDIDLSAPDVARDFIYIDDVIEAYCNTEKLSQLSGEIINIGTGVQHTLQDVVSTVIRLVQSRVKVSANWGALDSQSFDTTTWVADCQKAEQLLNWQPKWSLEDGLAATIQWYSTHRDISQTRDWFVEV